MPNINFDIFYDTDTVNFTASRGTNAPRAKPAWKVRNAPKLPPREPPQPPAARAFGPKTPAPNTAASPASSSKPDASKADSTPAAPKRKPKKLEIRNKKATNGTAEKEGEANGTAQ